MFQIILLARTVYNYFGKKTVYEKQNLFYLYFVGVILCSLNYSTVYKTSHIIDFVDDFNLFQNFVSINLILFLFIAILYVAIQLLINKYLKYLEFNFFKDSKKRLFFIAILVLITLLLCFLYEHFIIEKIEKYLFYSVNTEYINRGL